MQKVTSSWFFLSTHVTYVLINKWCWRIWLYPLYVHSSTSWRLLSSHQ